jgi:curved DNA-binding protein CbpA
MVSPTSAADSLLSPNASETSESVDHYAILEISPSASADDVRAAYRRLRVVYFSSDATKYRALQAAFDVLMDPETRQAYDKDYQARGADPSSIGEVVELGKHGRKDSAQGDEPAILEEEEEEEEEEERTEDPNWGLKRHHPTHEPLLGTQPYQSYVPIPTSLLPKSRSPTYLGDIAHNALPN